MSRDLHILQLGPAIRNRIIHLNLLKHPIRALVRIPLSAKGIHLLSNNPRGEAPPRSRHPPLGRRPPAAQILQIQHKDRVLAVGNRPQAPTDLVELGADHATPAMIPALGDVLRLARDGGEPFPLGRVESRDGSHAFSAAAGLTRGEPDGLVVDAHDGAPARLARRAGGEGLPFVTRGRIVDPRLGGAGPAGARHAAEDVDAPVDDRRVGVVDGYWERGELSPGVGGDGVGVDRVDDAAGLEDAANDGDGGGVEEDGGVLVDGAGGDGGESFPGGELSGEDGGGEGWGEEEGEG